MFQGHPVMRCQMESLDEFSNDGLENKLEDQCRLLGEFAALTKPSPYSRISEMKITKE